MKKLLISVSLSFLVIWVVTAYGTVADDTLSMFLSFDDGQGTVAKDLSMYGNKGKVDGAKWVDGKFGKALEFDGENDFVEVADHKSLLLLEGGTFMAWVFIKTEKGDASWPRILNKANTTGGTQGYDFLLDRALGYSIRFCIGGVCNSYFPLETDSWHHIAATYNGKKIYIYADGKKVGEGDQPAPALDSTGSNMRIGNSPAGSRAYQGIIDEVRIWSRALDENEINFQMVRGAEILSVDPSAKVAVTWGLLKNY